MRCFKCGKTINSNKCSSCGFDFGSQIQLIWNLNNDDLRDVKSVLLVESNIGNCEKKAISNKFDSDSNKASENSEEGQHSTKIKTKNDNITVALSQTQNNEKSSNHLSLKDFIFLILFIVGIILFIIFGIRFYSDIKYIIADYDETTSKIGFISREFGRVKIPYEYEDIAIVNGCKDDFTDKICWVKKDGLWGAISNKNKILIPFKYYCEGSLKFETKHESVEVLSKTENKYGKITYNGEITIPFEYDTRFFFDENNITLTVKGGKVGAINTKNDIVIPFEYEFLNDSGSFLYKYPYDYIIDFQDFGMAILKRNNKIGVIDSKNNVLIPFDYDWEYEYRNNGTYLHLYHNCLKCGVIVLQKDDKFGALTIDNEIIIPFEYDNIFPELYNKERVYARKGKETYEFDFKGNKYNFEFDNIYQ